MEYSPAGTVVRNDTRELELTRTNSDRTEDKMSAQVDPSHIMQVGMGFWGSKTLLSAVELDLFTKLGSDGMTAEQIAKDLDLDDRAVPDFPDALVALELLDREDHASDAVYRN